MSSPAPATPQRVHLLRLMSVWRSAGWRAHDPIELDLLAAGWVGIGTDARGHETLHVTDAGLALLAAARQRNRRAGSLHDRIAERLAARLIDAGRIVWRELSLRARLEGAAALDEAAHTAAWTPLPGFEAAQAAGRSVTSAGPATWRLARPDVFSVRDTSVEGYLHPMVHEVKSSRADLLSDLRDAAKRDAYRWLCSECSYVFPAGTAEPEELPAEFGVWVVHGAVEDGRFEQLRAPRHAPCRLPFAVWLALAKATPVGRDGFEMPQPGLGAPPVDAWAPRAHDDDAPSNAAAP